MRGRLGNHRFGVAAVFALLLLASCARDDPTLPVPLEASVIPVTDAPEAVPTVVPNVNECPAEGCRVGIQGVDAEGGELRLSFSSNFTPDLSGNHYHVYWARFQAAQVSSDAEARGVESGQWVETVDNPFTTTEAASVARRESSSSICVTAARGDHTVIDPDSADCRDVSDLM